MQFYGHHFETNDCIALKLYHHINSGKLHTNFRNIADELRDRLFIEIEEFLNTYIEIISKECIFFTCNCGNRLQLLNFVIKEYLQARFVDDNLHKFFLRMAGMQAVSPLQFGSGESSGDVGEMGNQNVCGTHLPPLKPYSLLTVYVHNHFGGFGNFGG